MVDGRLERAYHAQHGVQRGARRRPARRAFALALCGGLLLLLAACGGATPSIRSFPPATFLTYLVSFAPDVPYARALRQITDLGLQPGGQCIPVVGHPDRTVPWQPMGQRDAFARDARLLVWPAATPNDWVPRLEALPGVRAVVIGYPQWPGLPISRIRPVGSALYACPAPIDARTVSALTPVPLDEGEEAYASVTFAAPITSYDDALYAASDLGLALADPCYDRAVHQHDPAHPPVWHPMGQGIFFVGSHQLIVKTTWLFTSSRWRQQLQAASGVTQVTTPYTMAC